jgi:hypothetical protein
MRNPWWAFALPLMATCSTSSPTSPTNPPTNPPANPAGPQFSISFMLANSASLSLSEPIPCPGDWSTCARGSQPQGPFTTSTTTIRNYTLPEGTYRLTGIVQSNPSTGASVEIRIGIGPISGAGGGVARDGQVLGFVAFTEPPSPGLPAVISQGCGATFSSPPGMLEWSITFRVIATFQSIGQLCL